MLKQFLDSLAQVLGVLNVDDVNDDTDTEASGGSCYSKCSTETEAAMDYYELVIYGEDYDGEYVRLIKKFKLFGELYSYAMEKYIKWLLKENDFACTVTGMRYRRVIDDLHTDYKKFLDLNEVKKYLIDHKNPEMEKYIDDYNNYKLKRNLSQLG